MEDITIGCSTGTLRKAGISTGDAITLLHNKGVRVVEIGQSAPLEIAKDPSNIPWNTLKKFTHITLHAPKISYGDNEQTKEVFRAITIVQQHCELQHVVIHPDIVEDFSIFDTVSFKVAFENMDCQKKSFTTPKEMHDLLVSFPESVMVLDVNHVWTHDKTMALAKEFYTLCSDRITEVHVSGFQELHDPLYRTQQIEILRAIQDTSVPMIIESWMDPDEVELEINYIRSIIST